ncbi:glycoside hydrolase family 32 protein [Megamonas hypermegale]|uniref:glycoside hydrolase family 32 protein n=1 Tax=Megamonas hypermegale TaxID=158847 RepID=UPI0026EE2A66|nr:glycoside hydrolase family 32 protein [Megamonas hypermegale]
MNKPSIWHNKFHWEMPFGLINDPNGLCYHDGKYQIFYQWNPAECKHLNKHWGYTETANFVNYSIPQLALAPVDDFDRNGCYSGSARSRNGKLEILYTANLKDAQNIRYPRQVLAAKNSDGTFTKKKNAVDDVPKGYTTHFRDPYLFTHSGRSFFIIGAQRENLTGCALIYEEIGGNWILRGELKTDYTDFGYMWECPNLISVDGRDVLVFCPQGITPQGHKYNNLYQAGYLIGKFNPDTLEFVHGDFQELDGGFDFYAPQVLAQPNRNILIGWIGMPEKENEYPTTKEGWLYSLTLPRQLKIKNNTIYQLPVKELDALCRSKQQFNDCRALTLSAPCKITLDIDLTCENHWQGKFTIGSDELIISFDKNTQEFCINRDNLTLGGKGRRYFTISVKDNLHLDIYLDTSIIEIYCQNGEKAATACYYAQEKIASIPFEMNIPAQVTVSQLNSFKFI